jgi:hypothetical protein
MRLAPLASVVCVVLAAGSARADEIENPEFTNWAKFKAGASVTLSSTVHINGKPTTQRLTQTLVEVAKDKVVIATEVTIEVQGMVLAPNALQREVPKTVKLKKGEKKDDALAGRPAGTVEEGTETLKLAGTEVKARWFRYKGEAFEGTVWVSDAVPGRVVKHMRTEGGEVPVNSILELSALKKP